MHLSTGAYSQIVPSVPVPQQSSLLPNGILTNNQAPIAPHVPNMPNYNTGKSIEQTNFEIIENDLNQTQKSSDYSEDDQYLNNQELLKYIQANYFSAYFKIKNMLEGNTPINLKNAVYEVEHAFNNTFSYEDYNGKIQELVSIIKYLNGNNTDNFLLNMSIAHAMSDTLTMPSSDLERKTISYPFIYDFEDYYGDKDYNKMFVSKLLFTKSGQCHSMPLLYLIIAEEMGAKAYLSFSPNHSFIRFKDQNGYLYNYEATRGKHVTDQWVMGSGFISSNSVKNGIFLDTLNTKQVVAYCLNDLALGYMKIFGYEDTTFISMCTNLSLRYYPEKNSNAYVIKSNMYLYLFQLKMKEKGIKDRNELIASDPEAKALWEKHDYLFTMLANKGYRNIPRDLYDKWLESSEEVKSLKRKYQNARITKTIK